jgi:hypothetical protein
MSDELVKRLRAVDHMNIEDCFLQSPLFEKAADRIEADARQIAELREMVREAMDGDPAVSAAKVLYAFCCDPDRGDKESEAWRTMNWQALYRAMRQDDGDFPAMVCTWLEAFADPDEAALLVRTGGSDET